MANEVRDWNMYHKTAPPTTTTIESKKSSAHTYNRLLPNSYTMRDSSNSIWYRWAQRSAQHDSYQETILWDAFIDNQPALHKTHNHPRFAQFNFKLYDSRAYGGMCMYCTYSLRSETSLLNSAQILRVWVTHADNGISYLFFLLMFTMHHHHLSNIGYYLDIHKS